MRIGQGIDVHRFSDDPNRPLVLGLVTLLGERGLAGHSDADVATHALCDALLGAANLGDIGRHFADTDPAFLNIDSGVLLARVMDLLVAEGWAPISADVTIIAQQPRLADHLDQMSAALSGALGTVVAVKATTTEGLGAIGAGEGIAASAVVLVDVRP